MNTVRVTYACGDEVVTNINGTREEVREYFAIGKPFNLGRGDKDRISKVTSVVFLEQPANGEVLAAPCSQTPRPYVERKTLKLSGNMLKIDLKGPSIHEQVFAHVEQHLGDVIDADTTDETAAEECWTLAIDKANELLGVGLSARAVANAVCHDLGYSRKA